jgi:peptidoglycan/xylan/chitin deacetylase (PgdA/CDA1 family)
MEGEMRFFKPPMLITRLFPQVLWNIPNETNQVFLTFDDGPDEHFTPGILDILEQENICATFFVTGSNATKNLSLLKRIGKQGHEIGIHSYHHKRLILYSKHVLYHEIIASKRFVEQVIGRQVKLFRPPYGLFSPQLIKVCEQCNLKMVNWSYLTYDFDLHLTDQFILNYAEQNITSGEIIVLHDGHRHSFRTVKILPFFIKRLKNKGMKFALIQ